MKNIFAKLRNTLFQFGFQYLISLIILKFFASIGLLDRTIISKEKIRARAITLFKYQVIRGPFKGLILNEKTWWGRYDLLSKCLGVYESHVLNELEKHSKNYDHFIDIGAADGYYSVGMVKAGLSDCSTSFEISKKGREIIKATSHANGLNSEIIIKHQANYDELKEVLENFGPSLVLCDIEGGEFSLFNSKLLNLLAKSVIIIELHDEFIPNLEFERDKLIDRAKKIFDVRYLKRSNPNPNDFDELADLSDDLRMLSFSEGRPTRMCWILLTPK